MSEQTAEEQQQESVDDDWAAAMAEQADAESQAPIGTANESSESADESSEDYKPAEFQNLSQPAGAQIGGEQNMDVILDIPVMLSMEIGRTELPIHNLLQLNQGSVVELDRLVGEPMDVLVNGTLIAHGEVVVVNEKFGIRLTDVISPADRVKKLQ